MRYHALACDYDGTVAEEGILSDRTRAALTRVRASGRKLLLVTGRRLDDLESVCPDLSLFDAIVAENGALLFLPAARETRLLATPPPPSFVQALRARGVDPVDVGRVIVATWHPHEATVLEVIRALGLELQVIFNKGAVMVLPSGVNKATGLDAALGVLGLSSHNVVGAGDAENDHAFLSRCELAVAVANAIPSLKAEADLVTTAPRGAGVVEVAEGLLADDLARRKPRSGRHEIALGQEGGGRTVSIPAQGSSLLCAGTSGAGKSTFVIGFLERLAEQGYQHCIVDPEGDYASYEQAVVLGDARQAPTVDEVMDVLAAPDRNVAVNLIGLAVDLRPDFCTALLARLFDLRARLGRPHWIVLDEANHLLPESWRAAIPPLPGQLQGLVMVTVHPDHVSPVVLGAADVVLALGREPGATLTSFAGALALAAPVAPPGDLPSGEALAWWPRAVAPPVRLRTLPPRAELKRHARKYAEGELGPDQSFFFRGPGGRLNLRAQNLRLFLQVADGVDAATWLHHMRRGDYSRWIRTAIKDEALAGEVAALEAATARQAEGDRDGSREGSRPPPGPPSEGGAEERYAAETRKQVRAAIEARYTSPA